LASFFIFLFIDNHATDTAIEPKFGIIMSAGSPEFKLRRNQWLLDHKYLLLWRHLLGDITVISLKYCQIWDHNHSKGSVIIHIDDAFFFFDFPSGLYFQLPEALSVLGFVGLFLQGFGLDSVR